MKRYVGNQCEHCGVFFKYSEMDSYIPFGCADPESPEPFDPTNLCKRCSVKLYDEYMKAFANGRYRGDWGKSNAEQRAARDSGLVWIGNNERIEWRGKRMFNEYMPEIEYNLIKKKGNP